MHEIEGTNPDTEDFIIRQLCYENLNVETPIPGYFPHMKVSNLALSYSTLGSV